MKKLPNLQQALAVIHQPTERNKKAVNVAKRSALEAGDQPTRASYFDLEGHARSNQEALLQIEPDARLRDYRTAQGERTNRSMITVPPKLKANIQTLLDDPNQPWTTALIALAEYAIQRLQEEQKVLVVKKAKDVR
ncbi:hypothetical protein [Xanthomonas cannabis]|uniref:hypothetical protein n=1 Tax=Xanthomonas cannabis TaxID=1885674 RepID=UPI000574B288|nr:hypothetical protein [Xanthomonas cannabis]KHL59319.1 hypothetical protein OZ13_02185 [Xanthomonas cannabis pv. cannabis]